MRHEKWTDKKPNLTMGDIGFLLYTSKFGKPIWRACRVLQLHPDRTGTVPTVMMGLRKQAPGEGASTYSPRALSEMTVAVQRPSSRSCNLCIRLFYNKYSSGWAFCIFLFDSPLPLSLQEVVKIQ